MQPDIKVTVPKTTFRGKDLTNSYVFDLSFDENIFLLTTSSTKTTIQAIPINLLISKFQEAIVFDNLSSKTKVEYSVGSSPKFQTLDTITLNSCKIPIVNFPVGTTAVDVKIIGFNGDPHTTR
jgi:hypothetical protein